jgi:hypothetical protein
MSNHRLIVGSKDYALRGSRAEPWPCFLPWFPRAGNGHEVSMFRHRLNSIEPPWYVTRMPGGVGGAAP